MSIIYSLRDLFFVVLYFSIPSPIFSNPILFIWLLHYEHRCEVSFHPTLAHLCTHFSHALVPRVVKRSPQGFVRIDDSRRFPHTALHEQLNILGSI